MIRSFVKSTGIILICVFSQSLYSQEVLNELVATVETYPITSVDLENAVNDFKKKKFPRDRRNIESQVLDELINDAIVEAVLDEEAVFISDEKINSWIESQQRELNLTPQEFEKALQNEQGITLEEFKKSIEKQMKRQNVMQLRVPQKIPSDAEINRWYQKNKEQLGYKYQIRIIEMKFKAGNMKDELRVNNGMKEAHAVALKNFDAAAKKYSEHSSGSRGGLLSWYRLDELMVMYSRSFVENVYKTSPGNVSGIFVHNNSYFIVKVDNVSAIELHEVRDIIASRLAAEGYEEKFSEWLEGQRGLMTVEIFLESYVQK